MTTYNLTDHKPFRTGNELDLEPHGITRFYSPDHPLMQQLCDACAHGRLEEVRKLVRQWKNAGPAATPPPGPTEYPIGTLEPILFFAIRQQQVEIVSYLLDEGMHVSVLAEQEAVDSKCRPTMWQAFLDHGWDINRPYSTADPPTLAWILEDKELVEWFLAHGADPNAEARYGWTPWLRAIVWAPLEIIKLLHAAGGRLDLAVPYVCYGRTSPNHAAKFPDRMDVLKYLLDAGADIDARMWAHNRYGRMSHFDFGSALNIAVYCGKDDLVEELLRRGARTNIAADKMVDDGATALEFAKKRSPHLLPRLEERRRQENMETETEKDIK